MIRLRAHGRRPALPLLAGVCLAMLLMGVALAQSASGFDLSWRTLAGGSSASGGTYQVRSVIGQPLTGHATGGAYTVDSGFLGGASPSKFTRTVPLLAHDGSN